MKKRVPHCVRIPFNGESFRIVLESDREGRLPRCCRFVANDICELLDFRCPGTARRSHIQKGDSAKRPVVDACGHSQMTTLLNLEGVRALCLNARNDWGSGLMEAALAAEVLVLESLRDHRLFS